MSEPDPITALAIQLQELAREVDEARQQRAQDRQDVAAAKTALAHWEARLTVEGIGPIVSMRSAIKRLREDLDALGATLGAAMDQGKLKAPAAPRWDNLDQDQEAAQLAALREWVDTVLRVQYPGYKLAECWANHREALWELGALHAEWRRVFDGPRGANLEAALWFHERWLPGTLGRLSKVITCGGFGCQALPDDQTRRLRGQRAAGW